MKIGKNILLASLTTLLLSGGGLLAGTPSYDKNPPPMAPTPEVCGPWFAGISGGAWWVQDYDVSIPAFPTGANVEFGFDTGFGINVTPIGYRFSDMFSVSLEAGYFEADTSSATSAGVTIPATGGQLRLAPALLNANLTIPIADRLSMYLSAGGGVVYRELEAESAFVFPGVVFHDSGWNAIAQAKAGFSYEIAPCNFLSVGYRYQHVFSTPDDINAHMVEIGYTFNW
jgi:opacity protein-like surface antigen